MPHCQRSDPPRSSVGELARRRRRFGAWGHRHATRDVFQPSGSAVGRCRHHRSPRTGATRSLVPRLTDAHATTPDSTAHTWSGRAAASPRWPGHRSPPPPQVKSMRWPAIPSELRVTHLAHRAQHDRRNRSGVIANMRPAPASTDSQDRRDGYARSRRLIGIGIAGAAVPDASMNAHRTRFLGRPGHQPPPRAGESAANETACRSTTPAGDGKVVCRKRFAIGGVRSTPRASGGLAAATIHRIGQPGPTPPAPTPPSASPPAPTPNVVISHHRRWPAPNPTPSAPHRQQPPDLIHRPASNVSGT